MIRGGGCRGIRKYNRRIGGTNNGSELINKIVDVTCKNIETLNPSMWLEDIVIEGYLKYLVKKLNTNIKVYDTFFYPNYINKLSNLSEEYLIPIYESKHWSLVHIKRNNLYYYDSQISNEHTQKVISYFTKNKDYKINIIGGPQQVDDFSCGTFLLYTCNRILKGLPVRYDPKKADEFRFHVKMRLKQLYNL